MCHAIEFIETSLFTRQIKQLASDEDLRALQRQPIGNPDFGDLIQDTGGLRKIRMATGSQGKSGGVRVIYFLATREIIYLVLAYPKHTKESLSAAEKNELRKLTRRLKNEV
ncbi:type II toxin-antitoxin system RelE/ParE family toxin [Klebsiella variicola]|uniref:type II toxin-antitoxin system RelE/ParE family toxin n=1 Tax=Klebsiella variicola TaxID=244366 RepID=UPI000E1FF7CB|nr:type II toxin-antitoxin system RelE/ParE family toxin [Klebsiella variicola]HCB0002111.1 type II toxin-antitoxin system RelE/ParE family toxin [Klebsiella variicola subsp. variicola]ELA2923993.1 type II toxin-antitoxin system RelE/ParE family toxin [Klebsiella variicola]MBZ6717953.1 addiction module toxin RelE [Klebsiella variicola]MCI4448565.1 type II toxin-antitoxin system RelE/ParE family toxin [Klebsiella variicola]MDD9256484.1 type II toxin-antitoxin system RelE/ParE family toxin [Kleb